LPAEGIVLGLLARAKAIMTTPRTEWSAVAGESSDALALRYVAILASIPALARLLGGWLIGGYTPLLPALIGAVVAYALSFAVVFAVALVVDLFAPKFGGERSYSSALRLTAYSFTPVWLAGVFLLVPGASFLVLLGLYGLYLMWVGLPVLMRAPDDRALAYVVAIAACAIALDIAVRLALIAAIGAMR
jgi:Yip1 domain